MLHVDSGRHDEQGSRWHNVFAASIVGKAEGHMLLARRPRECIYDITMDGTLFTIKERVIAFPAGQSNTMCS